MSKCQPLFVGKRTLLIDDDLTQLKLLEGLLKKMGFIVSAFQSPVQALRSIEPNSPPDLVITDIFMPEISGWDLCRYLRSDVLYYMKDVPILVVSSVFLGEGIKKTVQDAGADNFIEMPIDYKKLEDTIFKTLEGRKKEDITFVLWVSPCSQCIEQCCFVLPVDNFQIKHVENIKEAIKLFSEDQYDLVVVSHRLHEDPTPLMKKIKEKNNDTVIVAILSSKEEKNKDFLYWFKKGVSAIIKEPLSSEHIHNLFEKIRLEKALIKTKETLEQKVKENLAEELKWVSILDSLPSGIFIKDKQLRYVRVNKAYANFFGKNQREFLDIDDRDLFNEQSYKTFVPICEKALSGDVYIHPDLSLDIQGKDRVFSVYTAPLKNAEGEITGIFGTIRDVTDFRKLQQNYKNLFESMQEAFAEHEFIFDEQGTPIDYKFLSANSAFYKMTGLRAVDIIGRTVKEVLPGVESYWILTYAQVVVTGNPITFEIFSQSLNRHYLVHAFKTGKNRFACVFTDITEKKTFEEEIKRLNREWQLAYDNINSVIWFLNENFEITRTNSAILKLLKLTPDEVLGKKCWEVVHGTREAPSFCPVLRLLKTRKRETLEFCRDDRWFEVIVDPVFGDNNQLVGFVHILSEITERKNAEKIREDLQKQLVQSQKLESIGRLAGGIAHDFNNMLSVIMGNIELSILKLETGESIKENLEEVRKAVERASDITKKILAFARKQDTKPQVLKLNKEISEYMKLLKRVLTERVQLELHSEEGLWDVYLDPAHLDMILLNLCVNARDAITNEGKITIELTNKRIDENFTKIYPDSFPGDYVVLRVSDTGTGIDPEVLPKIFDPFFTTKKMGEGTGLGLSTVYGTVKQNNGFITVDSELGKGSSFSVYFPRYKKYGTDNINQESTYQNNSVAIENFESSENRGVILVVDDERSVLEILNQIISRLGFSPIITDDPIEALKLAEENKNKIKLLISDIILPKMNGIDLAKEIEKIIPSVKTLFMSGYAEELNPNISSQIALEIYLVKKPFSIQILSKKIKEILSL